MAGIDWRISFIDACEAVPPSTPVKVGRGRGTTDDAGTIVLEWRAMQREAERLQEENERLHRIINKLTAN